MSSRPRTRNYTVGEETEDGKRVLSPDHTLPTARYFVEKFHSHQGTTTLRFWCGSFYSWNLRRYREVDEVALKKQLLSWLHDCVTEDGKGFPANPRTVTAALESLKCVCHLESTTEVPSWLNRTADDPRVEECFPAFNGILHIPTGRLIEHTPRFFAMHGADFDYEPAAPSPARWNQFLDELFGDDTERRLLLQEFAAYLLTSDTSQEKALLIIGPKRAGKGVIGRVFTALVGPDNVASPTTSDLSTQFGLEQLLGKVLALITDARFSGKGTQEVTERLLSIIGRDRIGVPRKFMPSVQTVLNTRFVITTNELPKFRDDALALPNRFVILSLDRSFFDAEETNLKETLMAEMPGILNWALAGWKTLKARGKFEQPQSSKETAQELADLASPLLVWLRERCELGQEYRTPTDEVFADWRHWSRVNGHGEGGTNSEFGTKLRQAGVGKAQNKKRYYRLKLKGPEAAEE